MVHNAKTNVALAGNTFNGKVRVFLDNTMPKADTRSFDGFKNIFFQATTFPFNVISKIHGFPSITK